MRVLKALSIGVVVLGIAALAVAYAPTIHGQRGDRPEPPDHRLMMLAGRGASIGASVRDVDGGKDAGQSGVIVESVRPDSPAARAGLKTSDLITEFDGEKVRSVRQFARLVEETAPDRSLKIAVMRDGRRVDLQITPESRSANMFFDSDRLRDQLSDLEMLPERMPFNFDFDWDWGGMRGRLGVVVQPLTTQLASYFGVKAGVLVAEVAQDSAAEKGSIKAGDVITAINGERVGSREDLSRLLRDADGDVSVAVTRDKKELTLKVAVRTARHSHTTRQMRDF